MLTHSQRNLTLVSPQKCQLQLKFNLTPEDGGKLKQFFTKDKEAMFEEIQQLKQSNNQLYVALRKLQAQLQYYKKEMSTISKDEGSPLKSSSRIKHAYLEKITTLEEENSKMQSQIQELQAYVASLKNPICKTNLDIYCLKLEEDNRQLVQVIEELQNQNSQLKKANEKFNVKCNALQIQYNKVKGLNAQLLFEMSDLKKRQRTFESRASCREIQRADDKIILELEQAQIVIRKYQQQIKQMEVHHANQLMDERDKFENLQKKNRELQFNVLQLEQMYEQEKSQYQSLQQSQKYIRRTVILKTIQQDETEQQIETEIKIKKNYKIEKNDIMPIARKVRLFLIGQKISVVQALDYLVNNENPTQQQLENNLSNRIFGLKDEEEINQMAAYLADLEEDEQFTTATRVRSIFKNLMENYQILSFDQLVTINQNISNRRQEINDLLNKKYPATYTDGYLSIENYLELLQNLEVSLNKNEADHLVALTSKKNKSKNIFLQQIYAPFECNEHSDDEEEVEYRIAVQLENPMSVSVDGEQDSALDIKMCNSQELKKKSQSELQQF